MAYNYEYPYVDSGRYNDDWLLNQMKQISSEWVLMRAEFTSLEEQFTALESFVKNYLESEDFQNNIKTYVDEYFTSDDFDRRITTAIVSALQDKNIQQMVKDIVDAYLNDAAFQAYIDEAVSGYFDSENWKELVTTQIQPIINETLAEYDFNSKVHADYTLNLKDYLRTMDFTSALNKALTEAPMFGAIYIPAGEYTYDGELLLERPVTLYSFQDGAWAEAPLNVAQISFNSETAIHITSSSVRLEGLGLRNTYSGGNTIILSDGGCRFLRFHNLTFTGTVLSPAVGTTCIKLGSTVQTSISNVRTFAVLHGVICSNEDFSTSILMENVWVANYYGYAFNLNRCSYCTLLMCGADCNETGPETQIGFSFSNSHNITLVGCWVETCGGPGCEISSCDNINVSLFTVATNGKGSAAPLRLASSSGILLSTCRITETQNASTCGLYTVDSSYKVQQSSLSWIKSDNQNYEISSDFSYIFPPITEVGKFSATGITISSIALSYNNGYNLNIVGELSMWSGFITLPTGVLSPIRKYSTGLNCNGYVEGNRAVINGASLGTVTITFYF